MNRLKHRPSRAALALLVLVVGVGVGCRDPQPTDCDEPTPGGQRCLIPRPPASSPAPNAPAGLDLDGLDAEKRRVFWDLVDDQFDPCGAARSFGETLRDESRDCAIALPLARFVAKRIAAGAPREATVRALLTETRRLNHKVSFRLDGRPRLGAPEADIVLVEFFDFECSYCREIEPALAALVERHPRVALVAKQCPIEGHENADEAARLALAAQLQGRYWPFHRALLHRGALDEGNLQAASETAGLDWRRLRADSAGATVERLLREDLEDADRALLEGTPSLWLDGVEVPFDRLEAILKERLAR